jgi:RimJ/RimL family protein N-acetyltransferase
MLVGKRVKLRPVEETDLPLLVEWRNQPDVWTRFFNKFPLSHSGQRAWYKGLSEDRNRLLLILEDLGSHEAVGTVGFDRMDSINRVAEYGNILIGPERFRRKGLAREATILILAYGFGRLNLNRIFLHVLEENTEAINLYRKCGFKDEGRLRQAFYDQGRYKDILLMSVLATEFSECLKSPDAANIR